MILSADKNKLFELTSSSEEGLSEEEAKKRLVKFGKNEIRKKGVGAFRILLSQFLNPLVYVLFFVALISYFLGEEISAWIILFLIFLNGVLGFYQEYKSERAAEKLERLITFFCKVLRNGRWKEINVQELVVGDVVRVETGDRVPADLRLFSADELLIDESILTGESYPVKKTAQPIVKTLSIHEMKNIAFMGSVVSSGSGEGVVFATGMDTFFGKTVGLLKQTEEKSGFEKNIESMSKTLVRIILISVLFIFLVNAMLEKGVVHSLLFAAALAVGIIPEALPVIITITLSNGSMALSRHGVITKRLSAIEDLGNVDVLCTDKTGTLTESKIEVQDYVDINGTHSERVIEYAGVCTSVTVSGEKISGNPIDVSIASYIKKGITLKGYRVKRLIAFDFERRRMSVIVEKGEKLLLITKGSPESILSISSMSKKQKQKATNMYMSFGEKGYRVIGVCAKEISDCSKSDERDMDFVGFVTFIDPPKKTVKESLRLAKVLGVSVKLITGDNAVVAKNIARNVGFEFSDDQVINGAELEELANDKEKLRETAERCIIFARVTPVQKHLIVKTLKENNHVVAFLGDGVNDAPSLKEADVGISVNNGADVTKEAADIILLHKSINAVVHGISGGRKVFSNVVKYITNTLAGNFGDLYTIGAISPFLKFIPLTPVQIILANFVSDAPMVSISTDNVDDEELVKPKKWDIMGIVKMGALFGFISMIFDIFIVLYLLDQSVGVFRAGLYLEVILSEIAVLVSLRSSRPFFKAEPLSHTLLIATIFSVVLGLLVVYSPAASLFGFVPLSFGQMLVVVFIIIGYFLTTEIVKNVYITTLRGRTLVDKKALYVIKKRISSDLH